MPGYDAVICGAGVAGLTLARLLGNQGRAVLVLEREPTFRAAFKGEVLQPRALRILDAAGALAAVRAHGALRADRFTARDAAGRVLGDLDYGRLDGEYDHMLVHNFRELRCALAANLPASVTLRFGAGAQRPLRTDDGRVRGVRARIDGGETDFAAHLTVACDGRNSTLRTAAGLTIAAQRYPQEFVGFDLADIDLGPQLSAFATAYGVVLMFPLPGRHARLYVQAPPGDFRRERHDPEPWLDRLIARTPALKPWTTQIHAAAPTARILPIWRHQADAWSTPGLMLAGDAAHSVHPIAAQGMAAAVDDAWVLAAALGKLDRFTDAGLDRAAAAYALQRAPRQAYVARLSHSLARLLTGTSAVERAFRRYELAVISRNPRLREILVHNMAGAGIHRFNPADRLAQLGFPDPRRNHPTPLHPDTLTPDTLTPFTPKAPQ